MSLLFDRFYREASDTEELPHCTYWVDRAERKALAVTGQAQFRVPFDKFLSLLDGKILIQDATPFDSEVEIYVPNREE